MNQLGAYLRFRRAVNSLVSAEEYLIYLLETNAPDDRVQVAVEARDRAHEAVRVGACNLFRLTPIPD